MEVLEVVDDGLHATNKKEQIIRSRKTEILLFFIVHLSFLHC
jgi:hypothetical protein